MSLKKCIPAMAAFLLVACGGDSSKAIDVDTSATESNLVVATFGDLHVCTYNREGVKAYVKDEKCGYSCTDRDWRFDYLSILKEDFFNPKITYGTMTDDRDGQTYKTVRVGDQVWMAENLNYQVDSSFCYKDSVKRCEKYGRLYQWAAAIGKSEEECGFEHTCGLSGKVRGVCPVGWHLPDSTEWEALFIGVGGQYIEYEGYSTVGKILKSQRGWLKRGNGTDAFGFTALPAGVRYDGSHFSYFGEEFAYIWGADEIDSVSAYFVFLDYDSDRASSFMLGKNSAASVRCLKD